jgi:hypothetical protein
MLRRGEHLAGPTVNSTPSAPCTNFLAVSLSLMSDLRDEPPPSLEDPREILLQQLSYQAHRRDASRSR